VHVQIAFDDQLSSVAHEVSRSIRQNDRTHIMGTYHADYIVFPWVPMISGVKWPGMPIWFVRERGYRVDEH